MKLSDVLNAIEKCDCKIAIWENGTPIVFDRNEASRLDGDKKVIRFSASDLDGFVLHINVE